MKENCLLHCTNNRKEVKYMKKITILGLSAAIVLGGLIALPKIADAYRGDPSVQGPNYSVERHEAMEKAFENNDYNAWKNLMQNHGRVTQLINEDNFAKFAEAHKLAEQGKIQEANQIRQSLGLGLQNGSGQGSGMGMHRWSK